MEINTLLWTRTILLLKELASIILSGVIVPMYFAFSYVSDDRIPISGGISGMVKIFPSGANKMNLHIQQRLSTRKKSTE
jgi:hypothetical protein